MKRIIAIISCFFLLVASGYAQQERNESILRSLAKGLEYSVRAGVNIGGTSPLPLPA